MYKLNPLRGLGIGSNWWGYDGSSYNNDRHTAWKNRERSHGAKEFKKKKTRLRMAKEGRRRNRRT